MTSPEVVTQLLLDWNNGDTAALDELMPLVYAELHRLAASYLSRERSDHTLQPTALVNEAYLRLIDQNSVAWQNRAQFFGIAAQMMRRILVNHARDRQADKRGGPHVLRVSLDDAISFFEERDVNLVALDDALEALGNLDQRQSQIVELRFFGGLTIEEVAAQLHASPATVKREWTTAKLWLLRELSRN
jgi:RNA polymerase sigma-70 factor (ECF subfamily)